jgi:gluconokinase
MQPSVLALDLGTTNTRAALYDQHACQIKGASVSIPSPIKTDKGGGVWMNMEQYAELIESMIDRILQMIPEDMEITAVGITSFWHSFLGIDKDGNQVIPLILWNDRRSSPFAKKLQETFETEEYHSRTGCFLHSSYYPARIAWLKHDFADAYHRCRKLVSPGEYLLQRWTGEPGLGISIASGTGLFNQRLIKWDEITLHLCGISEDMFFPVTDSDTPMPALLPAYHKRWQALHNAKLFPAIGDGAASNWGSGARDASSAAINIGTSAAIRCIFQQCSWQPPDDLWLYRLNSQYLITGAAFMDGGNTLKWARQLIHIEDVTAFTNQLKRNMPGKHGLLFLPYLHGERSPGWHNEAHAIIWGLSSDHDGADVLQSIFENVALQFLPAFHALEKATGTKEKIILSGGAFKEYPYLAQMISDALGHNVILSSDTEATSRGAAEYALQNAGLASTEIREYQNREVCYPDLEKTKAYYQLQRKQEELYQLAFK